MNVDSILISQFAVTDPSNALTVVRTFNRIDTNELPAVVPMMSISAIIHAHASESGTVHHFKLTLTSAKQGQVATVTEGNFTLNPAGERVDAGMPIRQTLVFNVLKAAFPSDGPYAFELYIDDTYYAAAAFFVELKERQ